MKKLSFSKSVWLFLLLALAVVLIVRCEKPNDPIYTIDARVNGLGGTLSSLGITQIPAGGSKSISIIPDKDHEVDVIMINGNKVSTPANLIYPFTNVGQDNVIEVTFKKIIKKAIVDISVTDGGTANPLGIKELTEGDNLDITFAPNMGYKASSVLVNGVTFPLTGNVYHLKNIPADTTKVKGVFEMSDTLRLLTQGKWKLDSILIRDQNGIWIHYPLWGVATEHQKTLTLSPDGTYTDSTDGFIGDGHWYFDNTKKPYTFHIGMTASVPEGSFADIEELDENSFTIATYNTPNIDPNDPRTSDIKLKYTHLK